MLYAVQIMCCISVQTSKCVCLSVCLLHYRRPCHGRGGAGTISVSVCLSVCYITEDPAMAEVVLAL